MSQNQDKFSILNFIFGGLSGMFGVTISHPIDTIKTNIQQNLKTNYNIFTLYKGLIPPLIGVGFEKAIVFGVYETAFQYLDDHNYQFLTKTSVSGALAGFSASFIVTPYERLKIQLQSNKKFQIKMINPKYLYQGINATFTRETPGFAIYFSIYQSLKKSFYDDKGKIIPNYMSFLYGGMSGGIAWCFIYPQDMIKTTMQSSDVKMTFTEAYYKIKAKEGMIGFFNGFHLALLRALPLHAGTFMMMEYLKKCQKKYSLQVQ